MASAWGSSWGSAWGDSWGAIAGAITGDIGGSYHRPYTRAERRKRGLEWDKRPLDERRRELEAAYAQATGEIGPEAVPAVVEAVKPYVEAFYDAPVPPAAAVDWAALARDVEAAMAVLAQLERIIREREDDEIAAILLLS